MASTATAKEKNVIKHAIKDLVDIKQGTEISVVYNIPQAGAIGSIIDMSADSLEGNYASKVNTINASKDIKTKYEKHNTKIGTGLFMSEEICFADYKAVESVR